MKCSGGTTCSACLRKAAWDGVPPPDHCEYDGGYVPARKPRKSPLLLLELDSYKVDSVSPQQLLLQLHQKENDSNMNLETVKGKGKLQNLYRKV